jgi:hypothetical protein
MIITVPKSIPEHMTTAQEPKFSRLDDQLDVMPAFF